MAGGDPRKRQNNQGSRNLAILKSGYLLTTVGIAGITLNKKINSQRIWAQNEALNIDPSKVGEVKYEDLFPNIDDILSNRVEGNIEEHSVLNFMIRHDADKEWDDILKRYEYLTRDIEEPGSKNVYVKALEDIDRKEFTELLEDKLNSGEQAPEQLLDFLEDTGSTMEEFTEDVEIIKRRVNPDARPLLEVQTVTQRGLEKEYPGMLGILEDYAAANYDTAVLKTTATGSSYNVHMRQNGNTKIIELPKFSSGISYWKGAEYKYKGPGMLTPNSVLTNSLGFNVSRRVDEVIPFKKMTGLPLDNLKRTISQTIDINIGQFVGNGNITKHIVTDQAILAGYESAMIGGIQSASEAVEIILNNINGKPMQIYYGGTIGARNAGVSPSGVVRGLSMIDTRAGSEKSALQLVYGTSTPFGMHHDISYGKVSQARANFARGQMLNGKILTADSIVAKLGPMSSEIAESISKYQNQEIPGKQLNTVFYMGRGKIQGVGSGGGIFIQRELTKHDGTLIKGKLNSRSYTTVKRNSYSLPVYDVIGGTSKDMKFRENQEVKMLLDKWKKKDPGEAITISKGTMLGSTHIKENATVVDVNVIKGELQIITNEAIYMREGMKLDQGKIQINKVDHSSMSGEHLTGKFTEMQYLRNRIIQGGAEVGVELILASDQLSKVKGGALGWGIYQKVMNDLVQLKKVELSKTLKDPDNLYLNLKKITTELTDIVRIAVGDTGMDMIDNISIDSDTLEPVVSFKPGMSVADTSFSKVIQLENAIFKAEAGDWKQLNTFAKNIDRAASRISPGYQLIDTITPGERDYIKLGSDKAYTNAIVRHDTGKIVMLSPRITEIAHESSVHTNTKVWSTNRGLRGFSNGAKATLDHMELAHAAGHSQYVNYLSTLMDYNIDYIRDKMFAAERKMYGEASSIDLSTSNVKMGNHKIVELSPSIAKRLSDYNITDKELKAAGSFRIINKELAGLQHTLSDDALSTLVNDGMLSFEDLRTTVNPSLARYSVDITEKSLVHEMVNLLKTSSKDEALFLKLPMPLTMGANEVNYVPIHKFDLGDMFELSANMMPDGVYSDKAKRFYTGSEYPSNLMRMIKELARVQVAISKDKGDAKKMQEQHGHAIAAINRYYSDLASVTKTKTSTGINALFEHRMPFSLRSVASMTTIDQTSKQVTGIQGIPLDSVYVDQDVVAGLLSGGKVKSMADAEAILAKYDQINEVSDSMKNLMSDNIMDDTAKFNKNIDKNIKNLLEFTENHTVLDTVTDFNLSKARQDITEYNTILSKVRSTKTKDIKAEQNIYRKMIKRIATVSNEINNNYKKDGNIPLVRFTRDTVNAIRDNKFELSGRLFGNPEKSDWSYTHQKVKIIQSDPFKKLMASTTLSDLTKKELSKAYDKPAGHIYVGLERLLSIGRDNDKDPINFILTTLDVLETRAQNSYGFSLLKESNIFDASDRIKGMDMLRGLTKETFIDTVMAGLSVNEDNLLKPASITSINVMHEVASGVQEGRVKTTGLIDYITEGLSKMYSKEEIHQIGLKSGVDMTPGGIAKEIVKRGREFRGDPKLGVNDFLVTETVSAESISVNAMQTGSILEQINEVNGLEWYELVAEVNNKERFKNTGSYDSRKTELLDAIKEDNKEVFAQYRETIKGDAENLKNIKEQTPRATKYSKGLYSLTYDLVQDTRERAVLSELSDTLLLQNTLSSKHGTPQILPDIVETLHNLANSSLSLETNTLNKLVDNNYILTLTNKQKREMGAVGNKIENVNMAEYEKYLVEKDSSFRQIMTAHTEAIDAAHPDLGATASYKNMMKGKLQDLHRDGDNKFMHKLVNSDMYKDILLDPDIAYREFSKNKETIEVVQKIRGKTSLTNIEYKERREVWKNIVRHLKSFSSMNNRSVFSMEDTAMIRGSGGGSSNLNLVDRLQEIMTEWDGDAPKPTRSVSVAGERINRLAAILKFGNNVKYKNGPTSNVHMANAYKEIQSRQTRVLENMYSSRILEESSVFRSKSILSSLLGAKTKATGSAVSDELLNKSGKLLKGQLLLGLMVGTIVGQAINQKMTGYAVPDLGGTKGLGGEYYENNGGLLGKEMEIMMSPKPPRVTPNYNSQANAADYERHMNNADIAYGSKVEVGRMENKFQGVVVK